MQNYILKLYITGNTSRSVHAVTNLRRICEQHLQDRYELVLIDVLTHPELAEEGRILATPTTVRVAPLPAYRVIGDLSDPGKVLIALGLDLDDLALSSKMEVS